ncbi:MAG: DUF1318 domain-containing protein [Spirochaetota bacterium]
MKRCAVFFICCTIASCMSFKPPKMHLTGKPTVLENQVVGDYKEIEDNAWAISSVQTNVQGESARTERIVGDEELFEAMKIRELHADKVREYKNEGAIGENNHGLLAYRPVQKYQEDSELKKILTLLIEEENRARLKIFTRSLVLGGTSSPTPYQIEQYGEKFAEEQREAAQENDWLQNQSGNWFQKQ